MSRKQIFDILLTALISAVITACQAYLQSMGHHYIVPASPETAATVAAGIRTALYIKYV